MYLYTLSTLVPPLDARCSRMKGGGGQRAMMGGGGHAAERVRKRKSEEEEGASQARDEKEGRWSWRCDGCARQRGAAGGVRREELIFTRLVFLAKQRSVSLGGAAREEGGGVCCCVCVCDHCSHCREGESTERQSVTHTYTQ